MQKFIKEQKIRFKHCDFAGIVFYPRYFEMLNDLVEDFFEEVLAYSFKDMHPSHGVPTVNVNADFFKPARIQESIQKSMYISKLGEKSVVYQFEYTNAKDQTIIKGSGTLVFIQKDENGQLKSKAWTADLLERMKPYVQKDDL